MIEWEEDVYHLEDLPDELIEHVLSYLEIKMFIACRRVNKQWHHVVHHGQGFLLYRKDQMEDELKKVYQDYFDSPRMHFYVQNYTIQMDMAKTDWPSILQESTANALIESMNALELQFKNYKKEQDRVRHITIGAVTSDDIIKHELEQRTFTQSFPLLQSTAMILLFLCTLLNIHGAILFLLGTFFCIDTSWMIWQEYLSDFGLFKLPMFPNLNAMFRVLFQRYVDKNSYKTHFIQTKNPYSRLAHQSMVWYDHDELEVKTTNKLESTFYNKHLPITHADPVLRWKYGTLYRLPLFFCFWALFQIPLFRHRYTLYIWFVLQLGCYLLTLSVSIVFRGITILHVGVIVYLLVTNYYVTTKYLLQSNIYISSAIMVIHQTRTMNSILLRRLQIAMATNFLLLVTSFIIAFIQT